MHATPKHIANAKKRFKNNTPDSGEFHLFLRFLVLERGYEALDLISVVEASWKWEKEFKEYLLWVEVGSPKGGWDEIEIKCPDCGDWYNLDSGVCYGDDCLYRGSPF